MWTPKSVHSVSLKLLMVVVSRIIIGSLFYFKSDSYDEVMALNLSCVYLDYLDQIKLSWDFWMEIL